MTSAQRAVEIWKHLLEDDHINIGYRESIGHAQHRLGTYFSTAGLGEQASVSSQAAADTWSELVEIDPERYTTNLVETLFNLSTDLWTVNQRSEAIQSLRKCVALQEAEKNNEQERSLPSTIMFANSQFLLGNYLVSVGENDDAVAFMQRAVDLRSILANVYSVEDTQNSAPGHRGNLAEAAHHLGVYLSTLGRYSEAVTAIQKAIDVGTELAEERPKEDRYRVALVLSYRCLCQFLLQLGREKEATLAIRRIEEIGTDSSAYIHK